MKTNAIFANVEMRIQTRQRDAKTGELVKVSPVQKNLLMDGGLNALARSTNSTFPAECFAGCRVGSGSTSDKTSSGAVTFTQAGTTLTASAGFFTAGMVGYIFKWGTGTGGNEVYITAFTSSTVVTVDTSATVAVPEVGTVWNVTRTALEALLYTHTSYETTAGSCQTTPSANQVVFKRTFNFAQQVASYNVNEVGYFRTTTGTTIFGRLVLGATEVVAPTNFLQVVMELTVTWSPSAPTAVGNVGTNIDTSGNAMIENITTAGTNNCVGRVESTGTTSNAGAGSSFDGSGSVAANGTIRGLVASYSQNGATANTNTPSVTSISFQASLTWTYNSVRGQMRLVANTTITTAGETLFGVCIFNGNGGAQVPIFDVKFTSTYALPTGSFLPQVTFLITYNRTLNN